MIMNKTYVYTGSVETFLPGTGIVKPGQELFTDKEINHPYFVIKPELTAKEVSKKLKFKTKK